MNYIISPANAQAAPGGFGGFDFMSILPLVLIFAVFYFFLIRPQQKKAQEQKNLLSALRRGDRIVTNGGLIGIIHKVISDQELQVEIAEGVRVRVVRSMVASLVSKTEPVSDSAEDNKTAEDKPAVKKAGGRSKKAAK
ncbi:MAG: preprotein translocase subunit YajC [Alphaproteobacteria bacterium]|nr:preprotein translocase subunit YajC [Alphaproteobacteria bacterium]